MSRPRILYFAEPIDQSDFGAWKESVSLFIKIASERGWLVFRPAGAWRLSGEAPIGAEIEVVNRYVMGLAGAVVAMLPNGVPTVGVPREVEWAKQHNVPVLAVVDKPGWSLYDVPTINIGDVPAFGQWIVSVEGMPVVAGAPLMFHLEGGQMPTRANPGDAGFDLYVSEDTVIQPGQFVDVPCGVRVALPPGIWGRITGRSSTLRRRELMVAEGVIDTGYRGPLYAGVWNLGDNPHVVEAGDRIAQFVLHENVAAKHYTVEVDRGLFERVPGDGRGELGFGSTGS